MLALVGCAVVVGSLTLYGLTRFLEKRTLTKLGKMEVRELFNLRLPTLYRQFIRVERARLRRRRAASTTPFSTAVNNAMKLLSMRALGLIPLRSYRGLRLEQTLARMIVTVDQIVDKDTRPTRGSRQEFFERFNRLVEGVSRPDTLDGRVMPEDLAVVYTVKGIPELLGIDPLPTLRKIWEGYVPDARRTLADEPVTDRRTLEQAHNAYAELQYLVGLLAGLDDKRARLLAELDTANILAHDTLVDLLGDARKRLLSIPQEELDAAGINPAKLYEHATSRENLATVPGLAEWCATQARYHGKQWQEELLPRLKREVLPYVKPRLARKWLTGEFEARRRSFIRCHAWWQRYTAKPVPSETPSEWLALADVFKAAAIKFGLPVGEETMTRWRHMATATFWLDQLLDESPDPLRAKEIYEQLIREPKPMSVGRLPDWPAIPRITKAVDQFKQSVESLGSHDHIIETAMLIGRYSSDKRHATTAKSYARLVLLEDTLTGELAAECMSDAERAHPAFSKFRRWCGWAIQAYGLFDSLTDLEKDSLGGLVRVQPTRRNQYTLRAYFLWVGGRIIIRHPRVFATLAETIDKKRA